MALIGLVEKASGASTVLWREAAPTTTFFGPFYYHGNAGAFMNLTLPVTIGLAWRAVTRLRSPLVQALWITLATVSAVAVFSNTSRMSQVLGGGILLVLAAGLLPKAFGLARRRLEWPTLVVGAVVIGFALYAVVQPSRLDRALQRWEKAGETVPQDARWTVAQAAWRALPEAGWSGFGPGTFAVAFPYFTGGTGEKTNGRWIYLHQDYLQLAMEWGWLGVALLGLVLFGGIVVGAVGAMTAVKHVKDRERAESEVRMDAAATASGPDGFAGARFSGAARPSGFPAANSVDPIIRGNVSGDLLGKRAVGWGGK